MNYKLENIETVNNDHDEGRGESVDELDSDGSDDESREKTLVRRLQWGLVKENASENWINCIKKAYKDDHKKGLYLVSKVLTSDGEIFPVDKAILMASSGYFHSQFANQRACNNHQLTFTLPTWLNINKKVMRHVLDFIFTREITSPSLKILDDFVRACKDLQIYNSLEAISNWMSETADSTNCIVYWRVSNKYNLSVKESMFEVILIKIESILKDDIEKLALDELNEILSHDKANIKREESTMKFVLQWIFSNLDERKKNFSQLVFLVRFGNAATGYIPRLLNEHEHPELSQLMTNDVVSYFTKVHSVLLSIQADPSPARYDIYLYPFLRPRIPFEIIFIYGGYVGSSPCKLLETYDSRVNKWFRCDVEQLVQRSYHGMVYLNELIYFVGGFDGVQQLKTVTVIDPVAKIWTNKTSMHHSRCYVAIAELDGKIYACGGFNGRLRHRSCEVYDPTTDEWTEIAPMNDIRSDAAAVAINDRIYVIGGFNGQQVHNSVEYYDVNSGLWTYSTPMVISRSGVNAVVWKNYIIVIGGNSGHHRENTVEAFDVERNQWSFLPSLNTTRSNFAACVMEETLYVLGGYDGFGTTTNCESLDLSKLPESKWTTVWPLSSSRSALSACVVTKLPNAKQYSWLRKELDPVVPTISKVD